MVYHLPELTYAYDALEPHIDARTMEIHHTKHHQGYVTNLNKAVEGHELGEPTVEELVATIHTLPEEIRAAVRNHGGGHANHSLFWTIMCPGGRSVPSGDLEIALKDCFEDCDKFKEAFKKVALSRFGSGWAWLSVGPDKKLLVEETPNQNSPLMHGNTPILGLDVWEHAYYLKYQNRRADYVDAFFHVIDWEAVTQRYSMAIGQAAQVVGSSATT